MSVNIVYSAREGLRGLRRARSATFITVSTMTVTLTLMGVFLVLTVNVQRIVALFKDRMALEVFIDPGLDESARLGVRASIARIEGVESVTYISPEEALERFREELQEDPMAILGDNPLPPSFQIKVTSEKSTPSGMERIAARLRRLNHVEDVVYHSRLYEAVNRYSRLIVLIDSALFLFVFLTAVILVANTLRLTILSQQGMIQIMRLVGATKRFIRRPYLFQGIIQGAIAGTLGLMVVWGLMKLVSTRFPLLLGSQSLIVLAPLAGGVFLGAAGSWIALQRFLIE